MSREETKASDVLAELETIDFEEFKQINANLSKVVENTIAIVAGYEKLNPDNLQEFLQRVRQDALDIAGDPISQEKIQEIINKINTALAEAIKHIEANGGVDIKKIEELKQEIQKVDEKIPKDESIVKKEEELEEILSQIKDKEEAITQKNQEIQELQEQIAQKEQNEETTEELQQQLTQKQQELLELQESLKEQQKQQKQKEQELEEQRDKPSPELATKSYTDSLDALNVKLSGNQTIAGIKTFSIPPISVVAPSESGHVANKAYVDSIGNGKVALSGNQTIAGVKTFSAIPVCAPLPTADSQLANRNYVKKRGGFVGVTGGAIDFNRGINFSLNLTARVPITCINAASNIGQSGEIYVYRGENISAFNAPFNFRIPQSGFGRNEVFSYLIISANFVRLTRS